jgi:excisionase family DNA binding protein
VATTEIPTLIPVREAARIAGVSRWHIYRLIDRGEVDSVRVGEHGPVRIQREWFLDWLSVRCSSESLANERSIPALAREEVGRLPT